MPELPDVTLYIEALEKRILAQRLENLRIVSPFLLRSVEPPVASAIGKKVVELRRLGKRICIGLEEEIWLVLHLMIAGRLHWKESEAARGPLPFEAQGRRKVAPTTSNFAKLSKQHLAAFDFEKGSLLWTEAGSQKRASLYLARGEEGLMEFDRGGIEVLSATREEFTRVLRSENHTLKRALTDPEWFSGIGNAYSDEILWEAKLSPVLQTRKMTEEEITRLFEATWKSLAEWTERLRTETGDKFPEGVTAFRPEMAVHGKYKQPCPRCGEKVQRIKYASNETNYCPKCQTGGKLLADRAFSRLLREDWPKTAEELEMRMGKAKKI